MLGPEGVLAAVVDFLRAALPARCAIVEQRLAATPRLALTPAQYSDTDQFDVDVCEFPLIVGEWVSVDDERVSDVESTSIGFVDDYTIRVHAMFMADGDRDVASAERGRNRLLLAVKETFLLEPALRSDTVRLARRRITGRAGPFLQDTPGRIISPGYLDVPVQAEETIDIPPLSAPPTVPLVITTTLT